MIKWLYSSHNCNYKTLSKSAATENKNKFKKKNCVFYRAKDGKHVLEKKAKKGAFGKVTVYKTLQGPLE